MYEIYKHICASFVNILYMNKICYNTYIILLNYSVSVFFSKPVILVSLEFLFCRLTSISTSSCNTLMQNRGTESQGSYPGSELTVNSDIRKERSPSSSVYSILKGKNCSSPESSILYSGHFQSEHQSKVRIISHVNYFLDNVEMNMDE